MNNTMYYLITGVAGFIGFHTAKKLLETGNVVVGIDNFNDYYDQQLKEDRNKILEAYPHYRLYRGDITDKTFVQQVFSDQKINIVCHLAAQAGVRYSLENPYAYVQSNLVGFTTVLHEAKNAGVKNFIFASSSSVYGDQDHAPFSETANTSNPISLYAATKKSNEVLAYAYHHLYGMHCTGLRFFTVYGPWGRPDMALFSFTKAIIDHKSISVFNNGNMRRDFTYIDDIVDGIIKACVAHYPYEIINLGNNNPVQLSEFIDTLEQELGEKAIRELLPIQPGDVLETHADITEARALLDWQPTTPLAEGLKKFVAWYREYYQR